MENSRDIKPERHRYLFGRYINGLASNTEESELAGSEPDMDDLAVEELLKETWDHPFSDPMVFNPQESQLILTNILGSRKRPRFDLHSSRFLLLKYAAAAVLILSIGAAAIYLSVTGRPQNQQISENEPVYPSEILPGGNKAILLLEGGQQIVLDSVSSGVIATQSGTSVIKAGAGSLAYKAGNLTDEPLVYNTILTPKGGQYQLILSDGTKVWLNASSAMRYPVEFKGHERRVFVTGEVYFEVNTLAVAESGNKGQRNPKMPFIVDIDSGKGTIEVTGTHFNINAYPEEEASKTTLLEGSIRFTPGGAGEAGKTRMPVTLLPGQQLSMTGEGEINVESDADTEQIIAWTKGYFQFSSTSLKEVMKQIARWYDVEVVFEGTISDRKFGGKIQRDLNLSEVLDILRNNHVEFRIEGRTLYVRS